MIKNSSMRKRNLANKLILLYTINELNKDEKVKPDRWKLQKTVFFMEKFMQEDAVGGMTYSFRKDKDGPLSVELYDDINELIIADLLKKAYSPRIKEDGIEFIEGVKELFEENSSIIEYVDVILEKVKGKTGKELKELSHRFPIKYGKDMIPIDDIPLYSTILLPLHDDEIIKSFEISDEWAESITLALNPKLRHSIKRGRQTIDFKKPLQLEGMLSNGQTL